MQNKNLKLNLKNINYKVSFTIKRQIAYEQERKTLYNIFRVMSPSSGVHVENYYNIVL